VYNQDAGLSKNQRTLAESVLEEVVGGKTPAFGNTTRSLDQALDSAGITSKMAGSPRTRILLVPSSKELGIDTIKRTNAYHL
jgi:hypothetical protein